MFSYSVYEPIFCTAYTICTLMHFTFTETRGYVYGINQNKQSRALYERLKKNLRPLKKHPQKLVFGYFLLHIPILHVV